MEAMQPMFYTIEENGGMKKLPYSEELAARIREEASHYCLKLGIEETLCAYGRSRYEERIIDIEAENVIIRNGVLIGYVFHGEAVIGIGRRISIKKYPYRYGDMATEVEEFATICRR